MAGVNNEVEFLIWDVVAFFELGLYFLSAVLLCPVELVHQRHDGKNVILVQLVEPATVNIPAHVDFGLVQTGFVVGFQLVRPFHLLLTEQCVVNLVGKWPHFICLLWSKHIDESVLQELVELAFVHVVRVDALVPGDWWLKLLVLLDGVDVLNK